MTAGATVGNAVAAAHDEKYEVRKFKIKHPTPQTFSGKLKSGGGCKVDRVVKVKQVNEYGGPSDALGTARTDESGRWTLTLTKAAKGYKTTPAMAAGLTNHVWTIEHVLDLMDPTRLIS